MPIFPANTPLLGNGGFIGNPATMFSVRVNYKDSKGFINPDLYRMRTKEAIFNIADSMVRAGGEMVVSYVKARLTPGKGAEVGATGKAADNIRVDYRKTPTSVSASIVEGAYVGNFFIRNPRGSKGPESTPPNRVIVDWLITKNIPLRQPERQKTWRMTKSGGLEANLRSQPSRPWKRDIRAVASIIGKQIAEEGRQHFKELMPVGDDRYDYYAEFFRDRRDRFERRIDQASKGEMVAHMRFLKTGFYRRAADPMRQFIG